MQPIHKAAAGGICLAAAIAILGFGSRKSAASSAVVPPALRNVHTLVTLGDSITQGGGAPGGYVWLMQKYLDALYPGQHIRIGNAGISGHKSTDMAERFQRDVVDKKPDLITISVGVNDVWHGFYDNHPLGDGPRGVPLETYRQKVEGMVEAGQKCGARVVVLSTTVIHEDLENRENAKLHDYNAALKDLASKHGCAFVDLFGPFAEEIRTYRKRAGNTVNLLTNDGVHMNAAGNQLMAYTILRGLGVPDRDLRAVPAPKP